MNTAKAGLGFVGPAVLSLSLLATSINQPVAAQQVQAPRTPPAPRAPQAPARSLVALQRDIDALLNSPAAARGTWGVVVRTIGGDAVYSHDAGRLFVPASNMKILTLAAASERLGWDFTFETRIVGAGDIDADGLNGDLVVVGSGDPTIDNWDGAATRLIADWADRLKKLGIHTISGRIIGDDDSFDDEGWGSGWAWDDLDRSFATGVGTLQFNQNTAQLHISPGPRAGDPAPVTIEPSGSGLAVRNLLKTSAAGTAPAIEVRRLLDSPTIQVSGSLPVTSSPVLRNVAVHNPTLYFVTMLREALVAAGIDVRGPAVDIDDIPDPPSRARGNVLIDHRSPPLSEMAVTMMRFSQNLYAETLFKSMGAQHEIGSSVSGRAAVSGLLTEWKVPPSEFRVVDGSGLSVYDLVTPNAFVQVLTHVARDAKLAAPFEASLPIAGQEGTLAQRMRGTPAERNVRAKTGSLSNARAMSGYLSTADRERVVFSILVNNFGSTSEGVDRTIDAILVRLAQFTRR